MRVAIVVDWLTEVGGAERVLLAVHQLYPDAPIYTSQYRPHRVDWFKGADVRTGWLNVLPRGLRKFMAPLRALYFKHLDLSEYDLVISVANAEAKGVKTSPSSVHVAYLQGPPTQYYWGQYDAYIKNPGFGKLNFLARWGLKTLIKPMRKADLAEAKRPDLLIANSNYVADEIKKYYKRDSQVVYPPVDVSGLRHTKVKPVNPFGKAEFYVVTGRQVNWKRVDLAVDACIKTNRNLLVIGDGAEHMNLLTRAAGHENIKFLPRYNGPAEIKQYLLAARGFIFCSIEPFGISPVEALACGCPVLALKQGGSLDIIEDRVNGIFFDKQTVDSLINGLNQFEQIKFSGKAVEKSVEKFDTEQFKRQFKDVINAELELYEK